jgi:hypothetical protein
METKHTLSDVLKRLVVDIDNMNQFLFSLQNILESSSENVTVSQTKVDGTSTNITVPSFGYLKGKIEDINTKFDTLISANSDVIGIKSSSGDLRKFELKKTSQLVKDLEAVQNSTFTVPSSFKVKNNWFFESFLNPLLYVSLDVSAILTDDIDQFVVKRIIVNSVNNDDVATFFDDNYKGQNNLSYPSLVQELNDNGIDFFEDDNIVDMEVSVNRYQGSFDVVKILEETGNQTLTSGATVSTLRRRYKLSTLVYTDILSGIQNSKSLAEGDVLLTANDTEYRVISINSTDTEVVLERIFGNDPITIGADILKLKPVPYRRPELQVNVGFNEREVIFIKPVSKAKNLTINDFSKGLALYTNELTIPLQDESTTTLADYYNNFVSDFGLILLNLAKEKTLPSILAITPDAPALDETSFKVYQIDQHIQDDNSITELNNNVKEKAALQQEVEELNKKIDSIKSSITTISKTPKEAKRLQNKLTESLTARNEKTAALSSIVTNITTQLSTTPQFVTNKKYEVRGFWQIPNPKLDKYGTQNVVQFKYRYRYLSLTGTQPNAQQQSFVDVDGATKTATFSPWTEVLTKPRQKVLDETTGLYVWAEETLTDSEVVNTNQLNIAIRKGELVEIQVKSLSEAGWPTNAAESVWSNVIQVKFPDNIQSQEEGVVMSQKAFTEKARLDFENSLNAKGLDNHLANQFTSGDKFYAHLAEDISSGFFTNEGNVIDLYQKLKNLQSTLDAIQQSINLDRGVIKVSVIDSEGNSLDVANGDTIQLFAGYYKDLIKDTTGGTVIYNEGAIITKQYAISIQNTSATNLELISLLFGGINELAEGVDPVTGISVPTDPLAYPTSDYHVNRRYDIVPIGVNSNPVPLISNFKQKASTQSAQVKSQFIHSRVREYGLSEEIYSPSVPATTYAGATYYTQAYVYDGRTVGTTQYVPANWGHYLPFNPQLLIPGTATDSRIWNGTTNASSIANGSGYLTEFCISKDHPHLTTLGPSFNSVYSVTTLAEAFRPDFNAVAPITAADFQKYLPFAHSLHFETSVSEVTNAYSIEYYKQASRITPLTPSNNTTSAGKNDSHYPIKLGFVKDDEYLIGKYTCGSYLYLYPTTYESVSVEGNFPARSVKSVTFGPENALNIPVLFQFRASDRLGYIGGYRRTGDALTNIKYSKKLGIDIILKDDAPFSFDLQVSAQYAKETTLDAPLVQSKGKVSSF